jgi:hypothetical protein
MQCVRTNTYSKPSWSPHVASCSMKGMTPATRGSAFQYELYAPTVQSALSCSEHGGRPGRLVAQPVSVMSTDMLRPMVSSSFWKYLAVLVVVMWQWWWWRRRRCRALVEGRGIAGGTHG